MKHILLSILFTFTAIFSQAQRTIPGGGTNGQVLTISGSTGKIIWNTPASGSWGGITGTLSAQTDLQNALNLKLNKADTLHLTFTSPLRRNGNAISMPAATSSVHGYLSSTDWSTFNNKFTLPSFTTGSIIFSNGSTLSQNNSKLFWDNTNERLGVGTSSPVSRFQVNYNPTASANYGLISLGLGPFNGSTSGFFTGNANGTAIAMNFTSSYSGYGIDMQHNTASPNDQFMHYRAWNKSNSNIFTIQTVNGGTYINNSNDNGTGSIGVFTNFVWVQKRLHVGTNYYTPQASLLLSDAPTASANYGQISAGNAPFDGSTSGFYTGSSNGTVYAANITGSADFINLEKSGVNRFRVDNDGNTIAAKYQLSALNTAPASATSSGTLGEIRVTSTYIYVCTAPNTWVRAALSTW